MRSKRYSSSAVFFSFILNFNYEDEGRRNTTKNKPQENLSMPRDYFFFVLYHFSRMMKRNEKETEL